MIITKIKTWQNGKLLPMYVLYRPSSTYLRFPSCMYNRDELRGWQVSVPESPGPELQPPRMRAVRDPMTGLIQYAAVYGDTAARPPVFEPSQRYGIRVDLMTTLTNWTFGRSKVKGVARLRSTLTVGNQVVHNPTTHEVDFIRATADVLIFSAELYEILVRVIDEAYKRLLMVLSKVVVDGRPTALPINRTVPTLNWAVLDTLREEDGALIHKNLLRYMSGQVDISPYPPAAIFAVLGSAQTFLVAVDKAEPARGLTSADGIEVTRDNSRSIGLHEVSMTPLEWNPCYQYNFSLMVPRKAPENLLATFTTNSTLMKMVAAKAIVPRK